MDIKIVKTNAPKAKPQDESKLGFGKLFSDHMFIMEYDANIGWHDARIEPYHNLSLDPASPVLHYGQEIFEGLKAYRTQEGVIQMFRPEENCKRLNNSAERLCMPTIPVEDNLEALKALVRVESEWVPHNDGTSLYLRPTMIADGAELGVHPSSHYIYYIIASPSGAYYPRGLAPIRIYVEDKFVRAVKGGIGFAKTGGNYAASLLAAEEAVKKGFEQILWLDGVERKYVEEVGAMNMMFVINNTICTAALEGSILPGITRMSIIALAKEMGYQVEERKISAAELMEAGKSGALQEAFGTGTAAVVSPVGELSYKGESVIVNNGEIGAITQKLYDTLTGIQWGKGKDTHNWMVRV